MTDIYSNRLLMVERDFALLQTQLKEAQGLGHEHFVIIFI